VLVLVHERHHQKGSRQFITNYMRVKLEVKQSRYSPEEAQSVPGSQGYQISWQRHRRW